MRTTLALIQLSTSLCVLKGRQTNGAVSASAFLCVPRRLAPLKSSGATLGSACDEKERQSLCNVPGPLLPRQLAGRGPYPVARAARSHPACEIRLYMAFLRQLSSVISLERRSKTSAEVKPHGRRADGSRAPKEGELEDQRGLLNSENHPKMR